MHKITLGEKTYTIPFFKGRAYRTMGEVEKIYKRVSEDTDATLVVEEYDALVDWFCDAFDNQFDRDAVYDNYPADDLIKDIFALYIAMMNMSTKVLADFPIPASIPIPNQR
ncbi:MAG: hypothetical protein QM308_01750 [Bacillota bacterium]|nr:hypothetical protein [Bacillota bacterium]